MSKSLIKHMARIGAALALVGGGLIGLTPSAAQAAGSCTAGPYRTEPIGVVVPTRWCPTWHGTTVYYWPDVANSATVPSTTGQAGYLYAGTNWVVCQFYGAPNPRFGTSYHNHYWLLTQGDVGYNSDGWGYIPATVVSYGGNEQPIPGVPQCNGGWL